MALPEIIYNYRDWGKEHHSDVLTKNELFFAAPSNFNDPFDFQITANYRLLDTKAKREKYIQSIVSNFFSEFPERGHEISALIHRMRMKFNNLELLQEEYEKHVFESSEKHHGIVCFSAIWNNILLWSHYGSNHAGFCVGLYEEKLRSRNARLLSGGMVNYVTDFPQIDPFKASHITAFTQISQSKARVWSYELEYRILKMNYPDELTLENRKLFFEDDVIAEVFLGLKISQEDRKEIIEICQLKNVVVYQIRKVPNKYQITCELVSPS